MKKFFTNKKKIWFIVLSSLIIYAVSFNNVFAGGAVADLAADWAKDKINSVIGGIAYLFLVALSSISVVFIKMIVVVAQYNQFIDSPAVISGWVIARDVCNMAFIVILLVIAFGVILRVPNYNLKQIPKLLLFAILINFSKTFCGLIIDIAQVVMLTFVSSFSASGGGYFADALQMVKLFSFPTSTPITTVDSTTKTISPFNTTVGAITGVVAAFVTLVVLGVFLAVLVIRIVMIWIYVILSPFAFLGFAFDPIKAKTGKIWGDFINQVISGPILAFFLWLALSIAATPVTPAGTENADSPAPLCVGITAFFCEVTFQKFIFTIGMLVGGLMVTQSLGGAIGSMAGKGLGAISKGKSMAMGFPGKLGKGAAGIGTTLMSRSAGLKNVLGKIGGNKYLPGVNRLATNALVGLEAQKRSSEEKAQKHVKNIKDTRILQRFANQTPITPWQAAIKDAAQKQAPSQIDQRNNRQAVFNKMNKDDLGKLPLNEWNRLAGDTKNGGVNIVGSVAEDVIQGNKRIRGAVNGVTAKYYGRSKSGKDLTEDDNNKDPNYSTGQAYTVDNSNAYSISKNAQQPTSPSVSPEKDAEKGDGNLSVNRFARDKDNTVAVNFDRLPENIFGDRPEGVKTNQIEGVNINDQTKIKDIASSMSKMLKEKIKIGGNAKQLGLLNNAKTKFNNIASGQMQVDNLSLVNSGAVGYNSLSNVKKVKVHEEIHGFGARDNANPERAEKYTEEETEKIMQNNLYSGRQKVGEAYKPESRRAEESRPNVPRAPANGSGGGGGGNNNALIAAIENLTGTIQENTNDLNQFTENLGSNFDNLNKSVEKNVDQTKDNTKTLKKSAETTKEVIGNLSKEIKNKV
jgi:hypothetical protein